MVNDGHKELREEGGRQRKQEEERLKSFSSTQAHSMLLSCIDPFNGFPHSGSLTSKSLQMGTVEKE